MICNKQYQDAGCSYCTEYFSCKILSGRAATQEMPQEDATRALRMAVKAAEVAKQIKDAK